MRFLRAFAAFLALPGVVAFLVPLVGAAIDPWRGERWPPGLVVLAVGVFVLIWCVRDFYVAGKGTLAPWDPPTRLVVVGLYRLMRNPMYVGVLLVILGWSTWFQSPMVAAWAVIVATAFHIRVVRVEEPWLERQFADEWQAHRDVVPRWVPRRSAARGAPRSSTPPSSTDASTSDDPDGPE